MRSLQLLFFTIIAIFMMMSCSRDQKGVNKKATEGNVKTIKEKAKENIENSSLSKYDLKAADPVIVKLPRELTEISGITMTPDGRFFAQQDERGIIYQIDYSTGQILKQFSIGKPALRKDFEDIVFANGKFYLLESNGNIYEFSEGNNGESVDYKVYKTELKSVSDVEGLCFDDSLKTLLLACKGTPPGGNRDEKSVFTFSLESMILDPQPRFIIKQSDVSRNFNPSGIERNPVTGTFFLISATGNEIVEISGDGKFMGRQKLGGSIHTQPEGITFSKEGTLFICNEGKKGYGSIVSYPFLDSNE